VTAPIYVATSNAGKLREMHALFADTGFELVLDPLYASPAEGDRSYADNAALKARSLHAALRSRGMPADVLADDSGLEVFALGGRPGVTTADYGGAGATWGQRRRALLAELAAASTSDRRARFVCALHFIAADGRELGSFATVDGTIALEERGELGFSFDPIFFYPPAGKTFAEITAEEKNRVSHRAVAAAAIVAAIDAAAVRLAAAG
jgi:XTP/dITP diphosphohydrolase